MHVHEKIGVVTVYNPTDNSFLPWKIKWNNRIYTTRFVDFHHILKDGDAPCHIFGVTNGDLFFRLRFQTETLMWFVEEVTDGIYT